MQTLSAAKKAWRLCEKGWLASWETVVADTSMITLSTEYAAHFHNIYIHGKEDAMMTGDHMKMLMQTLPFLVRDLISLLR